MIQVRGLTKAIDGRRVLDGVDLDVRAGEVFGILGPNGAGKTSLLHCLAGLWSPGSGSVKIQDLDRWADTDAIRKFTYFLPDRPYAHPGDSGRQHLEMIAEVYGVPEASALRQIDDLARAFDLEPVIHQAAGTYSNGQHKKLCIAGALVSNSRLLILDEPFTGEIDPPAMAQVKLIVRELARRRGVTCVLSTQIVALATELCDRVAIIQSGRVKACGTIDEIVAASGVAAGGLERVLVELSGKGPQAAGLDYVDAFGGDGGDPR